MSLLRRGLQAAPRLLLPLAVTAALVALLAPSGALAERSDLVLAALVLFTALGIPPSELASLRPRKGVVAVLVFAPFALLVPLAWAVSRLFDDPVRDGVLTLGVASTAVAAVALVALAGGSTVLALGVLTGSLVVAALAGPPVLGLLAQAGTDVAVGELVGRFALVIVLPLALGLAARARFTRLSEVDAELAGLASVTVVRLLYCAMSGAPGGEELLSAAAGSALFLLMSGIAVAAWTLVAPRDLRVTGGLVIELRDFAVAAALAAQAFGPPAATVSAILRSPDAAAARCRRGTAAGFTAVAAAPARYGAVTTACCQTAVSDPGAEKRGQTRRYAYRRPADPPRGEHALFPSMFSRREGLQIGVSVPCLPFTALRSGIAV